MLRRTIHVVLVLGFGLVYCTCTDPHNKKTVHHNRPSQTNVDSSYFYFEEFADLYPEKYVNNPDSFLNSFQLNPSSSEQHEIYANALIFMGYGLLQYGDNFQSIKYFEKALNHIRQNDVKHIATITHVIKPLANTYIRIGDNTKAIDLLEKTIRTIQDPTEKVGFLNNLANAYFFEQNLNKAKETLSKALQIQTSSLHKALLYNTLAAVYQKQKDTLNSIQSNQYALKMFKNNALKNDTLDWYCSALGLYAELHRDTNVAKKALKILDSEFPNSHHRSKAKIQLIAANILYNHNNTQAALQEYQKVAGTLSTKIGNTYTQDYSYTQALLGIAKCHRQQLHIDSALHYFQWAIENDFRTQQLITSKKDQLTNNVWNREIIAQMITMTEQKLALQPDDQTLLKRLFWCIELSKARLLINEINRSEHWENTSPETKNAIHTIRGLYQKIAQTDDPVYKKKLKEDIDKKIIEFQLSERYFETTSFTPDKKVFFQRIDGQNRDYFTYFITQDQSIHVIGNIQGTYTYHRSNDSTLIKEIQLFKLKYFSDSPISYNNNPKTYIEQAKKLTQQLLPNIAHAKAEIHISLDGDLYGLPFDALYDQDFLIQKHNFAYLNSFILYDLLKRQKQDETGISLLFRSEFPKPLPNLDFVNKEVKYIGQQFESNIIPPEEQQDSILVKIFSNTQAIHIAAHTILDNNENPIIYLRKPISTDQLRFYRIHSPLIFLSACNTGSGKSLPSEGMESIQRTFLGKGVPSIVATYWFANDKAMLALTSLFYDKLYEVKQPVLALGEAKRAFLKEASVEQQNPWYWANINYAGIGNEIGLRKNSNLLSSIVFFGLVLIFLFFGLKYLRSNSSLINKNKKSHEQPN